MFARNWIDRILGTVKTPPIPGHRVELPLVRCAHAAGPDQEMTPERVAQVLQDEETRRPIRP